MTNEVEVISGIVVTVGSAFIVGVWARWLYPLPRKIRAHLADVIQRVVHAETASIKAELKPNGGASLRDAVDSLRKEQLQILVAIRHHSVREWVMRGFEDRDRGFFETDSNGKLTHISQQVQQWTGRSMTELEGDRWISIIIPAMRESVKRWWTATWSDGSYGEMDQQYIGTDGRHIRVRVFAAPVIDNGTYIGHVGSITRLDDELGRPKTT